MLRDEFLLHFENGVLKAPLTLGEWCDLSGLSSVTSLDGLTLGEGCVLSGLSSVTSLDGLTLGEGCSLYGLSSSVDLGTPSLTPSELDIVRQIDVSRCDMRNWHCGTAHCLAGWCQYLSGREGDPEKIGSEMLPSLSHLFYCTEASEPVRQMLLRLQALPVN